MEKQGHWEKFLIGAGLLANLSVGALGLVARNEMLPSQARELVHGTKDFVLSVGIILAVLDASVAYAVAHTPDIPHRALNRSLLHARWFTWALTAINLAQNVVSRS